MGIEVGVLSPDEAEAARGQLAAILADCVEGGASISFMWPFTVAEAHGWWGGVIQAVSEGRSVLFGARLSGELLGSAQLGLVFPPNQPHRAEVAKLIVHRRARGQGLAGALMSALEGEARRRGRTLLTLDTATGSPAERLYERLGWRRLGVLPEQALWPDGSRCDATLFWKRL